MEIDKELQTKANAITCGEKPRNEWTEEEMAIVKANGDQQLALHAEREKKLAELKQKGTDFIEFLRDDIVFCGDSEDRRNGNFDSFASSKIIQGILEVLIPHEKEDNFSCGMLSLQWAIDGMFHKHFTDNILKHIEYMFENDSCW